MTTAVLAVLTGAALVAMAWFVLVQRRPGQLCVPAGSRLPAPAWWPVVLGAGLVDLAVGAVASPAMALVGVLLVAAALLELGRTLLRPHPTPSRRLVALARRVRRTCGPDARVIALGVGAGRVRLLCRASSGGRAGQVDDVVRDDDEVTTVAALVGTASS